MSWRSHNHPQPLAQPNTPRPLKTCGLRPERLRHPDARAPAGLAPIAIGLGLTLIHLVGIPVTNLSVNPARSTGPAVFVGGWALGQLWLFWLAPLVGAAISGFAYRWLGGDGQVAD